jgi:hypothetical protein
MKSDVEWRGIERDGMQWQEDYGWQEHPQVGREDDEITSSRRRETSTCDTVKAQRHSRINFPLKKLQILPSISFLISAAHNPRHENLNGFVCNLSSVYCFRPALRNIFMFPFYPQACNDSLPRPSSLRLPVPSTACVCLSVRARRSVSFPPFCTLVMSYSNQKS